VISDLKIGRAQGLREVVVVSASASVRIESTLQTRTERGANIEALIEKSNRSSCAITPLSLRIHFLKDFCYPRRYPSTARERREYIERLTLLITYLGN
jgi:hypothetical protein